METNLGVKEYESLGGKISLGIASPVVEAEIKALKEYGEELRAAGPANSNAAAKLHRTAFVNFVAKTDKNHLKKVKKTFELLNLES